MNRSDKRMIRNGLIGAGVLTGLVAGGITLYASAIPEKDITFTVKSKDRVCDGGKNGDCRYLVYTTQGVYENTDSLMMWKFNSSDVQNELEPGKTYTVHVRGWRSGFMSAYPNIISVKSAG